MELSPLFESLDDHIRNKYSEMGVEKYYRQNAASYVNPHQLDVARCVSWSTRHINVGKYLDLACGNGECTVCLQSMGYQDATGCDPFFQDIYEKKTGKKCYAMRFEEIALKGLPETYDTIFISYALHLCPKSYFKQLLYQLSATCQNLVVISPNNNQNVDDYFSMVAERTIHKAHCVVYVKN
jgi:2-polyprenyl-3-methyl-5-hydroxy-6-metoxy-1,4-benzoquinol methylase